MFFFSGISFGLMYLPSIVIVGYYFDKNRAFATGLAVCGSGIGMFVFGPLSKYMCTDFWRPGEGNAVIGRKGK